MPSCQVACRLRSFAAPGAFRSPVAHHEEERRMRHAKWVALLAVLSIVPQVQAQAFKKAERTERRIARLMDQLRDEMWAYRQELDFFRRAPEYPELVELRYRLRGQSIR